MYQLKKLIRFFLYIACPLAAGFFTYYYLSGLLFEPVSKGDSKQVVVEISREMSFRDIAKLLEEKKLIKSGRSLNLYARFQGNRKPISAGEYELSASMTPKQILKKLVAGDVVKRSLVVPSGISIWELGSLIETAGLMKKSDFDAVLQDPQLLAKAGIAASSFEGYLAPGDYEFSRPISAERIIWNMIEQGERNWPVKFSEAAEQLRMSRHEVLTLASILEKATSVQHDRELISSVLHNRLNKGMKLQSDETVIYGLRDYNGQITDADRKAPSPHNTYLHYGLPPTPIANPGVKAIEAALYPKNSEFLFYTADGNGGFIFSKTEKEHNDKILSVMGGGAEEGAEGQGAAQ